MIGEVELFFGSVVNEDRNVLDLMTADYTLRQRAARAALRHSRDLRQPVPPRHADRRRAARPAGQGRHPAGHLARAPHVAGAARQVGAREHHRRVAGAAARRRAGARRRGEAREAALRTRGARAASRQPDVCVVPPRHGSHRVRARELRRGRRVAREGRRDARRFDRRVGTAGRRHAGSTASSRCGTPSCASRRRSCAR